MYRVNNIFGLLKSAGAVIAILLFPCWLVAQDTYPYEDFIYGASKYKVYNYPDMTPGFSKKTVYYNDFVLVPSGRGVYVAKWDFWLWTTDSYIVSGVYISPKDSTTYAILYNKNRSQFCKIQKLAGKIKNIVLHDFGEGVFTMNGFESDEIFIWGTKSNYGQAFHFDGETISKIYESESVISDLCFFARNSALAVTNLGHVYILKKDDKPVLVTKFDLSLNGIETASDGSLFLSCPAGVFRMYDLDDPLNVSQVTSKINGPLVLLNDKLYIDWKEGNIVLCIDLLSF